MAAGAAVAAGAMAGVEAAGKENAGVEAAPSVAPPRLKPVAAAEAPAAGALMENPPVPAPKPANPHYVWPPVETTRPVLEHLKSALELPRCLRSGGPADASLVHALCCINNDLGQVWH